MQVNAILLCLSEMKIAGQECQVAVGHAGRVRCEPGWHLGAGWARGLADFDLWFVWAGQGRMWIDGNERELRPGTTVWMRPGRRYEAEQDPADRLGVNYVHFELRGPRGLPLSAFTPPFEYWATRQVEYVDTVMRRVIALAGEPGGKAVTAELLGALLLDLVREEAAGAAEETGIDRHYRDLVQQVAAQIRENPGRAGSVGELARAAGYSVDHFSRIFLKITGMRPQDYAIQARMERARGLLAESDLTIGMIAEALGFEDIFFFSRQFRQRTGQTPTAFRRGLRQRRG